MFWLPMESVHPLVVHFPIALLLTAFLLDGLGMIFRRPGLHRVALWNLCLGTVGAVAAVLTGLEASEIAKHTFEIHRVMERHEQLGIATAISAGILTIARLLLRDRLNAWLRGASQIILAGIVITLAYGAHLGGRLVYEFGVGGRFGAPEAPTDAPHSHHRP